MGAAYTVVGKAVGVQDLAFPSTSGFLIAGLRIDNESGSWITVEYSSYRLFVPPYTIGWLTPIFPKSQSGPNVYYSPGPDPTLYPSTTLGRPAIVTVYEDIVPPSPGVSYLNPFGGVPGPSLGSSCDDPLYVYVCNSEPPAVELHGIELALLSGVDSFVNDAQVKSVNFDSVVLDTDSYVTTGDHTFSGFSIAPWTVLAGTAARIPTGLGGWYEVSAYLQAATFEDTSQSDDFLIDPFGNARIVYDYPIFALFGGIMVNNNYALGAITDWRGMNTEMGGMLAGLPCPTPPHWVLLEDGDVVWHAFQQLSEGQLSGPIEVFLQQNTCRMVLKRIRDA